MSTDQPAADARSDSPRPAGPARVATEPRRRHVLVQAPIPPIDEDGHTAGLVGTILFAVGAFVVRVVHGQHPRAVPYWFIWVALAGLGLGLMYLSYCHLRRYVAATGEPRPAASVEQQVVDGDGVPDGRG